MDSEHQAAHNVAAIRETLDREGYCVVPGMLTKAQCAAARAALDRCAAEDEASNRSWTYDEGSNRRIWALLNRDDEVFAPLATHPLLIELMEDLLGPGFTLGSIHAHITGPGGLAGGLHLDQGYLPNPLTRSCTFNSVWMIDAFTAENGATRGVPGSHKMQRSPTDEDRANVKPIPMTGEEGSLLLMDGRFWHHTGANCSNVQRRGVFGVFNEYWIRGGENWTVSMPPEVLARHPELTKLCGFQSYNTLGSINGVDISLLPKTESLGSVTLDVQRERARKAAAAAMN